MSAGTRFNLSQHEHYPDAGDTNQFKLLWVEHGAANNLSAQVSDLLARLNLHAKSASSPGSARADDYKNNSDLSQLERGSYRNRFCAVRAAVPVVPQACAHSTPWRAAPNSQPPKTSPKPCSKPLVASSGTGVLQCFCRGPVAVQRHAQAQRQLDAGNRAGRHLQRVEYHQLCIVPVQMIQ